ncbi:hypothetical protein [Amycolatopsis sp. cmx-4-83]|uniref:hypothetical protein n=1 Tax=Amycolatopsis sp. cmx-4-83 TaxID=2790940 RepID=UPI0039792FC7
MVNTVSGFHVPISRPGRVTRRGGLRLDWSRLTKDGGLRVVASSLVTAFNGVIAEVAGPGFKVSGVRFRTTGSFVETMQKATAIGRRLVRAVLNAWGLPVDEVGARMRLTQPVPQTRQTTAWRQAPLELRLLAVMVAMNLSAVVVVLVVLLLR